MRKKGNRKIARRIIALFLLSGMTLFYFFVSRPVMKTECEKETISKITNLINESNDVLLNSKFYYEDMVRVQYDEGGSVSSIFLYTSVINQYSVLWGTEIQKRLDGLREYTVEFPCGVLTGSVLLAPYGKPCSVRCRLISNADVCFKQIFSEKGINQTMHTLLLEVNVHTDFLTPSYAEGEDVTQTFLLCRGILAGKVPSTYIEGGEDALNYLDLLE